MPDSTPRPEHSAATAGRPRARRTPAPSRHAAARQDAVRAGILAGGLLAALLLIVAEFTTLFYVHVATSATPVKSVSTGSHHSYALIPIAVAAAALTLGAVRYEARTALLALGALGVATVLIALLGDLPDAQATGLVGSPSTHFIPASSTPSAGLYMETLGGVLLLVVAGGGFLLLAPAVRGGARGRSAAGAG
jgi:hypothetical protein